MLTQVKYRPGVMLHIVSFPACVALFPGLLMLRVTTLARSSSSLLRAPGKPLDLVANDYSRHCSLGLHLYVESNDVGNISLQPALSFGKPLDFVAQRLLSRRWLHGVEK
jgi:hypothetical protein